MKIAKFSILCLLILVLSLNVFALTYRSDVNNGSWSQYNSGLASTYYETDLLQATNNRGFETDFNLSTTNTCAGKFCLSWSTTGVGTSAYARNASVHSEGSYSGFLQSTCAANATTSYFFGQNEILGDSNISFDYKAEGISAVFPVGTIAYGYYNDSNSFTQVGVLTNSASLTTKTFTIPQGHFRLAFQTYIEATGQNDFYIDNVVVKRNNAGTFFKDLTAPYCSSISDCSNIDNNANLTANAISHLYWITDYTTGATCTWTLNGVAQSNLIEMSGGMYYGLINDSIRPSSYKDFNLNASCTKPATTGKGFYTSPRIYADGTALATTLTASNNLNSNVGVIGTTYSFYSNYKYSGATITGATCTLTVDGTPQNMTWDGTKYATTVNFTSQGTHTIFHSCSKASYADANSTYTATIGVDISAGVTITPISNVSSAVTLNAPATAIINSTNATDDIIFSVVTNATGLSLIYNIQNNGTFKDKQYFIYTSDDGITWTFNDSLTFGNSTSYNDPIQKIWNYNHYDYSFTDSMVRYVPKYYKLVLNTLPIIWETIRNNSDWINVNPPTSFVDANGKNWDLFADSNYTQINSYTSKRYPDLTTTDLNVGFELQFTAYSTTNSTLKVGYSIEGVQTTVNVPVTTTTKRFSVPIDPTSNEARILITSDGNNNQVYITDYAIVPKSYFSSRLEVLNENRTELNAILNLGSSKKYIREGMPFVIKTSAYDRSADLQKLTVQTIIGSVVIKSQDFLLSDATSKDKVFTWDETLDGFIDLNGTATNPTGLRDVFIRATLYNTSNQSVSEQITTVKILQYPYFPQDLKLVVETLNSKLGTNPKVRFSIQQKISAYFLGISVAIFDSSHTISSPNYLKEIYASELGCVNTLSCAKELTFDDYVFEGTGNVDYTIQVTALISTQNKDYTDSYTNSIKHIVVTPSGYVTYSMRQYIERHQSAYPITPYQSSERIPLILGVVDDASKNLGNTLSPYFTLDVNGVSYTTKFYPDAFAYDETSGKNMWLFNQYLYDDSGNLFPTDVNVKFKGFLVDKRNTQSATDTNFGFADRCTTYPTDLIGVGVHLAQTAWNATGGEWIDWQVHNNDTAWIANFIGSIAGSISPATVINLAGCLAYPPDKVTISGTGESLITLDDTYTPSADNREALFCGQKYDLNTPVDVLGDEFECVLLIHQDEEQIDGINIQIGNENSDYTVTDGTKQYIDFTITSNDIIFTDLSALIRNWTTSGNPTQSPTIQDIVVRFFHDTFTTQLSPDAIKANYKWTQLMGGDNNANFYTDWNSSIFNKAIAFKISGLSVINARDYLNKDELSQVAPKDLLSYASANKKKIVVRPATITIYNNSTQSPYKVIETTAPFVINNAYSTPQKIMTSDGNIITKTVPEKLNFKVISTMLSANSTKQYRLTAPLTFQYVITKNPQNAGLGIINDTIAWITDIFYGETEAGAKIGLFNSPLGFLMFNWFWVLLLVGIVIVGVFVLNGISPFFVRK